MLIKCLSFGAPTLTDQYPFDAQKCKTGMLPFLAEAGGEEGHLIGGVSLLSGYINKVRQEEKNVLFVISGDMVQGSLIDKEYRGLSTIEIM